MPLKPPRPTESELAILRILWERGPGTVREVVDSSAPGTGYTTVLKMLQIMTDKGLVLCDNSARTHVFRPTHPETQTQRQLVEDLMERAFGGSAQKLVLQALSGTKPSRQELAELRKLLNSLNK